MAQATNKIYIQILFGLFLLSVFLLPSFPVIADLPKIHGTDILLPAFLTLSAFSFDKKTFPATSRFLYLLAAMLAVALASLLVNERITVLRDVFELMKLLKFAIVFLFIFLFIEEFELMKWLRITFILLVIFNFLHYVDFLGFNQLVVKYYGSEIQVDTFGLNSLGQPDTKRILGTVGNPNNNAILFLFFIVFFFPKKKSTLIEKTYFLTAVFCFLACQSRTGLVAFTVIFILGAILRKYNLGTFLLYCLGFISMHFSLIFLGNIYMGSFGNIMKQNSVRGRLETWNMLWQMIKKRPLLGYSPFKDYFYSNNIYAESEYFQNTWRYGFIGLLAYLAWMLNIVLDSFRNKFTESGFRLFLFTIVILITGLTNCPLSDTAIYMMFALCCGLFFAEKLKYTNPA